MGFIKLTPSLSASSPWSTLAKCHPTSLPDQDLRHMAGKQGGGRRRPDADGPMPICTRCAPLRLGNVLRQDQPLPLVGRPSCSIFKAATSVANRSLVGSAAGSPSVASAGIPIGVRPSGLAAGLSPSTGTTSSWTFGVFMYFLLAWRGTLAPVPGRAHCNTTIAGVVQIRVTPKTRNPLTIRALSSWHGRTAGGRSPSTARGSSALCYWAAAAVGCSGGRHMWQASSAWWPHSTAGRVPPRHGPG